ncbi:hypothetical protein LGR54_02465 [Ancylobacter sp. Lp-2]|uniref:hypothetical protein n=1 Tax=Ancylobacter sp. Lp-2 TaxID=2881339 RepID=UPI001E4C38F7|nr:hypothetical protein [Ancylobacter sp. Lp-2]MCB4767457.1 hypothetical protein [Ancylobacter sp. Lp-2]
MARIDVDDPRVIHALLDGLVEDGDSFDTATAAELIARVPITLKSSPFQFKSAWNGSTTQSGYAAGVGQSSIKEKEEKSVEIGTDRRWRIGGYKIEHEPGQLDIELMWADTKLDPTGSLCRLTYDPPSRRPLMLYLGEQRALKLGPPALQLWPLLQAMEAPGLTPPIGTPRKPLRPPRAGTPPSAPAPA